MGKIWTLSLILAITVSTPASAAHIDLSNAKIVVLNPKKKIQANAADMLRDEIDGRKRSHDYNRDSRGVDREVVSASGWF
jgi:hypothetical protein